MQRFQSWFSPVENVAFKLNLQVNPLPTRKSRSLNIEHVFCRSWYIRWLFKTWPLAHWARTGAAWTPFLVHIRKMEGATEAFLQFSGLFDRLLSGVVTVLCPCFCPLPLFSPPLLRLCLLPVSLLSEQSCKRRWGVKGAEVTEVPEEETRGWISSAAAEVLIKFFFFFFLNDCSGKLY